MSYRGVLPADGDRLVFYATPPGGSIGIYLSASGRVTRLLGIGDPVIGSTVTGFALNPVSINRRGQPAIRLELADGRQAIVRAG